MQPIRIIYDETPDVVTIPEAFRHGRSESIIWPLPADTAESDNGKSVRTEDGKRRRAPPPALAGRVRELGDVMSSASASDWGLDE